MSDERPHLIEASSFYLRTKRTEETIELAFLDLFSTPNGIIVREVLEDAVSHTQIPYGQEVRAAGMKDLFLFMIDMMARGYQRRTQAQGWLRHETDPQAGLLGT